MSNIMGANFQGGLNTLNNQTELAETTIAAAANATDEFYSAMETIDINSPTGLLELTAKQQQMQQALMASANLQKSHSDMVSDLLRKLGG